MASPDESSIIITEYNTLMIISHCTVAATVLFLYDFILTIGEEVEYFWTSQHTGAAVLFYLNRHLNLLVYTYNIAYEFSAIQSNQWCTATSIFQVIIQLLPYLVWAAFSALRAFALSDYYRWTLSFLVFALSLVPFAINMAVFAYGYTSTPVNLFGCLVSEGIPYPISRQFAIASRTCLLAADCIVIGITWLALFNDRTNFHRIQGHTTLARVLLTDGTIYFLVLVILNTLQLVFSLLSIDVLAPQNASLVTRFTGPLTAILIQHFMLHLQSVNRRKAFGLITSLEIEEISRTSSVVFNRVLGSLAASVGPQDYWEGDGEDIPNSALGETMEPARSQVNS